MTNNVLFIFAPSLAFLPLRGKSEHPWLAQTRRDSPWGFPCSNPAVPRHGRNTSPRSSCHIALATRRITRANRGKESLTPYGARQVLCMWFSPPKFDRCSGLSPFYAIVAVTIVHLLAPQSVPSWVIRGPSGRLCSRPSARRLMTGRHREICTHVWVVRSLHCFRQATLRRLLRVFLSLQSFAARNPCYPSWQQAGLSPTTGPHPPWLTYASHLYSNTGIVKKNRPKKTG